LLVGCDQLLWKNEWILGMQPLWQGGVESPFSIALWTESADSGLAQPSPIPGLYHTRLLPLLERLVAQFHLAMRGILRESEATVYFATTSEAPGKFAFNTPEQLRQLLRLVAFQRRYEHDLAFHQWPITCVRDSE